MKGYFRDRTEAGRLLAAKLVEKQYDFPLVVLALPRGGVPVGYEIAKQLGAPFDFKIVRKLGIPGHEELALGAITSGGGEYFNEQLLSRVSQRSLHEIQAKELQKLNAQEALFRGDRAPPPLHGKTVIVVDDGIATGATIKVALASIALEDPKKLVVASPVAPLETKQELRDYADDIVILLSPESFTSVGYFYQNFYQVRDEEVKDLLHRLQPH